MVALTPSFVLLALLSFQATAAPLAIGRSHSNNAASQAWDWMLPVEAGLLLGAREAMPDPKVAAPVKQTAKAASKPAQNVPLPAAFVAKQKAQNLATTASDKSSGKAKHIAGEHHRAQRGSAGDKHSSKDKKNKTKSGDKKRRLDSRLFRIDTSSPYAYVDPNGNPVKAVPLISTDAGNPGVVTIPLTDSDADYNSGVTLAAVGVARSEVEDRAPHDHHHHHHHHDRRSDDDDDDDDGHHHHHHHDKKSELDVRDGHHHHHHHHHDKKSEVDVRDSDHKHHHHHHHHDRSESETTANSEANDKRALITVGLSGVQVPNSANGGHSKLNAVSAQSNGASHRAPLRATKQRLSKGSSSPVQLNIASVPHPISAQSIPQGSWVQSGSSLVATNVGSGAPYKAAVVTPIGSQVQTNTADVLSVTPETNLLGLQLGIGKRDSRSDRNSHIKDHSKRSRLDRINRVESRTHEHSFDYPLKTRQSSIVEQCPDLSKGAPGYLAVASAMPDNPVGVTLADLVAAPNPSPDAVDAPFVLNASNSSYTDLVMIPAAPDAQQSSSSSPSGTVLVNLVMQMIDPTTAAATCLCTTYVPSGTGPSPLTMQDCMSNSNSPIQSNQASQTFAYSPSNGVITPMWMVSNSSSTGDDDTGGQESKRDFMDLGTEYAQNDENQDYTGSDDNTPTDPTSSTSSPQTFDSSGGQEVSLVFMPIGSDMNLVVPGSNMTNSTDTESAQDTDNGDDGVTTNPTSIDPNSSMTAVPSLSVSGTMTSPVMTPAPASTPTSASTTVDTGGQGATAGALQDSMESTTIMTPAGTATSTMSAPLSTGMTTSTADAPPTSQTDTASIGNATNTDDSPSQIQDPTEASSSDIDSLSLLDDPMPRRAVRLDCHAR